MKSRIVLFVAMAFAISSCSLLGIHMKVQNPSKQSAYPSTTQEIRDLGTPNTLRTGYDVTFYKLDIDIDAKEKSLGGWVEMRGTALQDMPQLQIDLHPNLTLDELHFSSRSGALLTAVRTQRAVVFSPPTVLHKGDTFSIHVRYHGKPIVARRPPWSGGTVWKKDKNHHDWLGVACESEGASIWFPCKDLTNDEPDSAVMRFTIPQKDLTVVSNGMLEKEELSEGKHSLTWRVHYPINLYNITYYVGDFANIRDTYTGVTGKQLYLSHYVLRNHEGEAREHFQKVKKHIQAYEEAWGPYAFYEDGFKLVESPYAGMEHQSAIAYGNGFKNDLYGSEDYIMLHETGHEWFGNAISAADLTDVWLQEGITTYGESVYLENEYSKSLGLRHLLFYRLMIKNKRPVVGPENIRYFNYKDGDVYVKGAWILHTLRHQLQNDTMFFTIMRTFYRQQALKTTNSKQFIQTVSNITGSDYNWFFDQYLYRNSVPVLEYQLTEDALYYRWIDCDSTFNKLLVKVKPEGYNETVTLIPSSDIKKLTLPGGIGKELQADNLHALFGIKSSKKLKKQFSSLKD